MMFTVNGKSHELFIIELLDARPCSAPDIQIDEEDAVCQGVDDERVNRIGVIVSDKS